MRMKIKRIVVISDLQVPFHDKKAVRNVAQFIRKYKPDDVLCVGDEIDFQTISRWSTGRDEWSGSIGRDRDETVRVLAELQVTTPQPKQSRGKTLQLTKQAPAWAHWSV
jgi:hypothetical protein